MNKYIDNIYEFKIIIIGPCSVGKTSIARNYCLNIKADNSKPTIGADLYPKQIMWNSYSINLNFWDIAGQDRNLGLASDLYFRGADGCITVYDSTNELSLESALNWKKALDNKHIIENIPTIMFSNKIDLNKHNWLSLDKMNKICKDNNYIGWFQTSALDDTGINEGINFLIKNIMEQKSKEEYNYEFEFNIHKDIKVKTISKNSFKLSEQTQQESHKQIIKKKLLCCT